jgi:hypothetical protein
METGKTCKTDRCFPPRARTETAAYERPSASAAASSVSVAPNTNGCGACDECATPCMGPLNCARACGPVGLFDLSDRHGAFCPGRWLAPERCNQHTHAATPGLVPSRRSAPTWRGRAELPELNLGSQLDETASFKRSGTMKNLLMTGLLAGAMVVAAADLSSAADSQGLQSQRGVPIKSECRTPSDYAWMIKTGRCPG